MRLAIFIPARNEQKTIGKVITSIPSCFPGISKQKIFVIDDGSTDQTVEIARKNGAEVETLKESHGLANVFKKGLQKCLEWEADVMVHFDADGQYKAEEISLLIDPILKGEADMVIGNRQIEKLSFMGWQRKYGNRLGSFLVRLVCGSKVQDVSSGFRAYSKEVASRLEVYSSHTYTHETIIEAAYKNFRLVQVPITFLPRIGSPSRLTHKLGKHIIRSVLDILKARKRYKTIPNV